jgi:hypothetical protein
MTTTWIADGLGRLRADIASANTSGNVEGLLARYIVGDDPRLGIAWGIDCEELWLRRSYDPSSLPTVSALGYTEAFRSDAGLLAALDDGMQRAATRDPLLAGPGAALHDPAVLLGLALAAKRFLGTKNEYAHWLGKALGSMRRDVAARTDPLLAHAAQLCGAKITPPVLDLEAPLGYCAAFDWWLDHGAPAGLVTADQRLALRASIVERALTEGVGRRSAHQAALLWRVLRAAVSEETSAVLRTRSTVSQVLTQFESCLRRWRWDSSDLKTPVRWPIRSEREVQDILWLMLRGVLHDLEDEDTLPKFGHSTYRADLGIPSLGLLIEVKFARTATDFKTIEKQVLEDVEPYRRSPERYREILVFIYDDSCSVQEHETTRRALRSVPGIADVLIVSRPSHLPTAADRRE